MSVRPVIVFIPGLLCTGALWQAQVEHLGGDHEIFIGDTTQDDSIAAMAARILAGSPARFALCGLSMGGYVAMEIMRTAPERVTHLVLTDTSARQDDEGQRQRRLDMIALAQRGKFKGVTPRLLPFILAPENIGKPGIGDIVMLMAQQLGKDVFLRQQAANLGRVDSRPSLPAIACPTAVIVGESDQQTPPELAMEMAELIGGAQLHIIPQAGHLPPLESPQIFNHVLTGLFKF